MIPHSRPSVGEAEIRAVEAVLRSGAIAQGKKVAEFERLFCEETGRRYAVAVSSGTSALYLSLIALGIGRGDEVILPSYTCAALLHAVNAVRARPVLVDVEPSDFNLSAEEARKKIHKRTKAIIVPHVFGRPAEIEKFCNLGVPVIEDGTQALGASVGNRKVGSFGEVSIFSFYATKMIATGEGGMILTDSRHVARMLFDLRDYDKKKTFRFRTNAKMTDLEAALGIEQMKRLDFFIARRREIAQRYDKAFEEEGVEIPPQPSADRDHVYYRYAIRVRGKLKEWIKNFETNGVEAKSPVFKPLHQYLRLPDRRFPVSSKAMREVLSIPIYPSLTEEEVDFIWKAATGMSRETRLPAVSLS